MDIIDTVSLAGSLVLAIPIALLGVEFIFVEDQIPRGVAFLAIAAALVVGQHYLGAEELARRLAGSALKRVGGGPDGGETADDVATGHDAGADRDDVQHLIPDAETGEAVAGGDGGAAGDSGADEAGADDSGADEAGADDSGADEAGADEETYKR